ncbi:purine and uridine phosphorylase [Lentithecium fluviatile CBS 122367]|uniref:Purine and uridine phosphorylase n=1 Tax=Lentithecium fluviatile CBS 122367 TaxID=1168545 RepID=A0A6G1J959_9PLEO|nr:purine and uridine phosphorylase [Lentithecium fluviatile CBS 122367]
MVDVHDYTVGCICALPTPEGVALRLFLDKEDDPLKIPAANPSSISRPTYITGTMGNHKVAIATLPEGSYGIASATSVIEDMVRSFPNLRCCLMVGIGGGAPNLPDHDIRLGDVVVSTPPIQGQPFRSTQHLNEPPKYLMSAVGELVQRYEMDDMPLQRMADDALPDYIHPAENGGNCSELCGDDPSHLVDRPTREEGPDDLIVHRGVIASGSALMKDATMRDQLAKDKGILCFEMEAAGLMNTFPCLVIRGICDYSDSHKNDRWHGYAAMMAAAYAKQILSVLQPWDVEAMDKISASLKSTANHFHKI